MAYWMRVFCTDSELPPIDVVLRWVAERGPTLSLDAALSDADLSSRDWEQAAVVYQPGKQPFLAEVNGIDEAETREEIEEFVELLEDVPGSPAKDRVLAHLARTTLVVANQIPTPDFEDAGYDAVGEFMRYFVEHNGGMIQADNEGFYEGDQLVVPLD